MVSSWPVDPNPVVPSRRGLTASLPPFPRDPNLFRPRSRCPRCARADSQHCDFYWAAEAVEWAYTSMLDDIEATRSKYPGEEGEERDEMQTETEFRMDVQHES